MEPEFSVCALLYGGDEFWPLHQRCLESLRRLPKERCELRIALNAVTCQKTRELIDEITADWGVGSRILTGENLPKYRRMRELLDLAPLCRSVMWFDDDSYIKPEIENLDDWLDRIGLALANSGQALGSLYRIAWRPGQQDWVKQQPWYMGRPLLDPITFITGGWWAIRTDVLLATGWPWPELSHNGGDVMLSVCLEQKGYTKVHFNKGVGINADSTGRESNAPRRGLSEPPIGVRKSE